MAKKKSKAKAKKKPRAKTKKRSVHYVRNYVVVTNKGYGGALKGTKIFFEGPRPTQLKDDGSFTLGKHILEALRAKFKDGNFALVLTKDTNSILTERGRRRVRLSMQTHSRHTKELWNRTRDVKLDIAATLLQSTYPEVFTGVARSPYVAGSLARTLNGSILTRLSSDDRDALNAFIPEFWKTESAQKINVLTSEAQMRSLKQLAEDLEQAITAGNSEHWWQQFIRKNILVIQQGYIKAIEKLNISVATTKYPDFSLITHDGYLDILEIKKPNTTLLNLDNGRGNYYWHPELSKAIAQTENYIETITRHGDAVRNAIRDEYKIELKVIRPRGIILAGNFGSDTDPKERDGFRVLSQSTKNVTFVTYDELLTRLRNYIEVLEEHAQKSGTRKKSK